MFRDLWNTLASRKAQSPKAPHARLKLEALEGREVPAALTVNGLVLSYAPSDATVEVVGSAYKFTEASQPITCAIPGCTGSGTTSVTVPASAFSFVSLDLHGSVRINSTVAPIAVTPEGGAAGVVVGSPTAGLEGV